jgi:hypothetical protein
MYCRECGNQLVENAAICMKCGVPTNPPQRDMGDDRAMRMLLPVGRSGYAIAAGYLGLFSVLVVPAPIALLFSLLAIRDMKKNPKKHGMGRAVFGLVMGGAGTAVLIFMLAATYRP